MTQDALILKSCNVQPCKRRRPKNENRTRKKNQIKCFIRNVNKERVPVYQKAFLNILGITRNRLNYVMMCFAETGHVPTEKRGGDHKKATYQKKVNEILKFINKLKCVESHYCRSSSLRMYLDSKLSKMYNEEVTPELVVKPAYFRHIFNTNYNLSFQSPRTDVCSVCLQFLEQLKYEKDPQTKTKLMIERRVHKLRAKAFFNLLREEREDLIILSFDCQKNLVLPKVPDQSAYYSRQLYIYNFTIVQGSSRNKLNKDNVFSYYWTEDEFGKGSNEIASAVYDRLNKIDFGVEKKIVRLIADGCSGQNKNSTVIGMCCKWLLNAPLNIERVELIFPVVGHSFLPSDRVFALIEKQIKK